MKVDVGPQARGSKPGTEVEVDIIVDFVQEDLVNTRISDSGRVSNLRGNPEREHNKIEP